MASLKDGWTYIKRVSKKYPGILPNSAATFNSSFVIPANPKKSRSSNWSVSFLRVDETSAPDEEGINDWICRHPNVTESCVLTDIENVEWREWSV